MARFQNDPFPGTDYSKYLEWTKVVLPSGEVFYEVPGHPGYVFDPTASNATGRKVFRANPKGQIDDKKKQDELIEQQKFNQSPAGQLIPVAGSIGGIVAASKLASASSPLAAIGEAAAGTSVANAAASGAAAGTAGAATEGLGAGLTLGAGSAAPEAAAAVAQPGLLSGVSSLGALPLAGIAAGTYLGGRAALNLFQGKEDNSLAGKGGRVVLGMATGGLSEVARPFLMHKSTRDVAKKHTGQLLEASDDAKYQSYVQGMRKQYDEAPTDPTKPFAGKYASWDEYKKGGLEAGDLTGVYGNIKTYGAEWANLSQEQRQAITQANIDSGIYDSKKGEVEITNSQKAIENKNNVLKGFQVGAQAATKPVVAVTPAQAAAQGAIVKPVNPIINNLNLRSA